MGIVSQPIDGPPTKVKYTSALIGISCLKVSLYLFRECHHSIPLYNPGCTEAVYAGICKGAGINSAEMMDL